jgi:hypothetical protein
MASAVFNFREKQVLWQKTSVAAGNQKSLFCILNNYLMGCTLKLSDGYQQYWYACPREIEGTV